MQLQSLDLSVVSFLVLCIILLSAYNHSRIIIVSYRLFIFMLLASMMMLVIDILGWVFNGQAGVLAKDFNVIFNLLLYIAAPITGFLWILYTLHTVSVGDKLTKNITIIFCGVLVINGMMSIISLQTGWFFYVDEQNIYHRGNLFLIHVVLNYVEVVAALVVLMIFRKNIEKRNYYLMLLYYIPIILGTVLQIMHYGVSYNWVGQMIALVFIYIHLLDREMNIDYLTGTYNRRQLESYFNAKIKSASGKKTFAAIMIDLKDFKKINDTFGHTMGDEALQEAVGILRTTTRRGDFIARFGGDEFIIVIDMEREDQDKLQSTVNRIQSEVEKYNQKSQKPYTLGFTMGYTYYDEKQKMKAKDFFQHIDRLMYMKKKVE